jgi:hypothetical protein
MDTPNNKGDGTMNKTTIYMKEHGWVRVADGGTAGVYSNGKMYVMCNGMEWFASRTANASERYARGWANMLPAMKFADAKAVK